MDLNELKKLFASVVSIQQQLEEVRAKLTHAIEAAQSSQRRVPLPIEENSEQKCDILTDKATDPQSVQDQPKNSQVFSIVVSISGEA